MKNVCEYIMESFTFRYNTGRLPTGILTHVSEKRQGANAAHCPFCRFLSANIGKVHVGRGKIDDSSCIISDGVETHSYARS